MSHPINIGQAFLESADIYINPHACVLQFPTFQVSLTEATLRWYDVGKDKIDKQAVKRTRTIQLGDTV